MPSIDSHDLPRTAPPLRPGGQPLEAACQQAVLSAEVCVMSDETRIRTRRPQMVNSTHRRWVLAVCLCTVGMVVGTLRAPNGVVDPGPEDSHVFI